MSQRVMRNEIGEVISLSRFGPEKLTSRRNVKKKIANGDGRATRMCRVFDVAHATTIDRHARCGLRVFSTRCQLDSSDGRDRSKRFATKTERTDRSEILCDVNLQIGRASCRERV